jgi:hypothetical protein
VRRKLLLAVLAALSVLTGARTAEALEGRVIDATSGNAVAGATVTVGAKTATTDAAGGFVIQAPGATVMARAPGYRATSVPNPTGAPIVLPLLPFHPKALYLSFYGIGYAPMREAALGLIEANLGLNALVIDVKGDRGLIGYPTEVPEARRIGADRVTTIPDLPGLLGELHDSGIYTIARIVVFKDNPLATARPDLAVRTAGGGIYRDREGIAVEAARAGFDEIQFDYVRFPDAKGIAFSQPSTMASRIAAIGGFLAEARRQLAPYDVFLAIDIFGYICWNLDDTGIGQRLEDIVPLVDYVSPMLYPSGFQFGIPGFRNPVQHPYEIVRNSLDSALGRTGVSPLRFRPWLQAFKDYKFDRREFGADEIKAQMRAAEGFGSDGWMLWNPHNRYGEAISRALHAP